MILQGIKITPHLKKAVNDGHSHVHGLLQQAKLEAHLYQPVDQNSSHIARDLPALQVSRSDTLLSLRS